MTRSLNTAEDRSARAVLSATDGDERNRMFPAEPTLPLGVAMERKYDNKKPPSPTRKRAAAAKKRPDLVAEATAATTNFALDAEAVVADLEESRPTGLGPLERALAARVRSAAAQLLACAGQVKHDGLMVVGSMGQERAHPLLKTLADLRRELADCLKELTFRVEQAEMIALMNGRSRPPRLASEDMANLLLDTIREAEPGSQNEPADRTDS